MATVTTEKPVVRKEKFHLPPVGWSVHWYAQGSRSEDAQAAMVTQVQSQGLLNMHVFRAMGQPQWYGPVRHVDDPFHASHPEAASRLGGWDWIPGHLPSQEHLAISWEKIVLRFQAGGHTPESIAAHIERTTADKVLAYLKRADITPHKPKDE